MNTLRRAAVFVAVASIGLLAGCNTMQNMTQGGNTERHTLTGALEVPPNDSKAVGQGTVTVGADRGVKVRVIVSGMTATAAHIHEGAASANGPVIVPLDKESDSTFVSKADAKFTDSQYQAYKAGRTYINVHSAKHPGGEIRVQLKGQ